MPCNSGEPYMGDYQAHNQIELLTRCLCDVLTKLEQYNKDGRIDLNEETFTWWEKHKVIDKIRKSEEQKRIQEQREKDLEQYNLLKRKLGL